MTKMKIQPEVELRIDELLAVRSPGIPLPQIVPLESGNAQLEWHQDGVDLEIEIDENGPTLICVVYTGGTEARINEIANTTHEITNAALWRAFLRGAT